MGHPAGDICAALAYAADTLAHEETLILEGPAKPDDAGMRFLGGLVQPAKLGRMEFERITFDPEVMGGRACIRGMRIPASVIVGQVAHGASVEEILQGYPDLEPQDIRQALEYAAWLTREEVFSS